MRLAWALAPLIFSSLAFAEKPRLVIESKLTLPSKMAEALQAYDKDFKPWAQADFLPSVIWHYKFSAVQAPSAVIGDFNGDNISDAALLGRNKSNGLLLVILSSGASIHQVVQVEKTPLTDPAKNWYELGSMSAIPGGREYGIASYLTYAAPGNYKSSHEERAVNLKTDAFNSNYYEKGSVMYYFDGSKFVEYTTAD